MHTNTIVSILGLAASARAHIIMNTPKGWEVNNSPLELDGSDFPCKGVSYDSSVSATKMNKGEKQPMKFTGSAVHGGGSCQVSLTTDAKPTKDSVWKVIKSFEGGCPAQGIDENYPENAGMELPDTYNFEIPDDVPDGKYTLAWTWFNKVGNREMYMNCAPIEASGGGGDESAFGALPDMFTANIFGESTCRTPDSVDLEFPDPGQYVEKLGSGTLTKMEATDCPSSGGSGGGSSGGDYSGGGSEETTPTESGSESSPVESGGSYESAPAESGSESPAESGAAQPSAQPSAPSDGGIFAPIDGSTGSPSSSAEAPAETSAAASPVESSPSGEQGGDDGSYQPEEPTPSTGDEAGSEGGSYEEPLPSQDVPAQGSQEDGSGSGSSSGSDSGGSAGGHEAGTECESNGAWNCIDGATYQRCASGVWSAVMQLSQGTECTPGEGENLQMVRKRGLTRFGAKFLL